MNDPAPARRSIMKGATWATPAVAIGLASPAYAASPPANIKKAIDTAFEQVRTSALTIYASEPTRGLGNDGSKTVVLNLNNYSPYALEMAGGTQLKIQMDTIRAAASNSAAPTPATPSTAWGSVTSFVDRPSVTSPSGTSQTGRSTNWTYAGRTSDDIPANLNGQDNVVDMTFQSGYPALIVKYTLLSAPILVPTLASIGAAAGLNIDAYKAYYDSKVAAATPVEIAFAGHLLAAGSEVKFGRAGKNYVLPGKSQKWTQGASVWSNTVGNYTTDSLPPTVAATAEFADGIF